MGFVEKLGETEKDFNNTSFTENGAKGYKTTNSALLDLNYKISSLRGVSPYNIYTEFLKAFHEDKELALKWLFYIRDAREGLGERHVFKAIFREMAKVRHDEISHLISMIPEYGRWDDLFILQGTLLEKDMVKMIYEQIQKDIAVVAENMDSETKPPISLLAKWMPSINTHSPNTRYYAKMFANRLGLTLEEYRKMLKNLRDYINIVETKMSANEWDKIDYSTVPSRANLIYSSAFYRHDAERRAAYIESVKSGKEKINSGVLYPHEIVHKIAEIGRIYQFCDLNNVSPLQKSNDMIPTIEAMEELWKALPDVVSGKENRVLCIRDGSGSMVLNKIPETKIPIWDVATALTIYFAERIQGEFHNKFITFSMFPELVEIPDGLTLYQKLGYCNGYRRAENTNIEAVFYLILKTAIDHEMTQEDLPETLLIVSDMEFDSSTRNENNEYLSSKLFEEFSQEYQKHGYNLPRLVFWNINSRTNTIPVKENENGVLLISGYSVNLLKMVLGNEVNPYQALVNQLMSDRYAPITTIVNQMLDKCVDNVEHTERSNELLKEYLKSLGLKIAVYDKVSN